MQSSTFHLLPDLRSSAHLGILRRNADPEDVDTGALSGGIGRRTLFRAAVGIFSICVRNAHTAGTRVRGVGLDGLHGYRLRALQRLCGGPLRRWYPLWAFSAVLWPRLLLAEWRHRQQPLRMAWLVQSGRDPIQSPSRRMLERKL